MLQLRQDGRILALIRHDNNIVLIAMDPGIDTRNHRGTSKHLRIHTGRAPALFTDVAQRREIIPLITRPQPSMESRMRGHICRKRNIRLRDRRGHGARQVADSVVEAIWQLRYSGDIVVFALVARMAHSARGGGKTAGACTGGAELGAHFVGIGGIARVAIAVLEVGGAETGPSGGGGTVREVGLGAAEGGPLGVEGGGMWDVAYFGGADEEGFASGFEFACGFFFLQGPLRFGMTKRRCVAIR